MKKIFLFVCFVILIVFLIRVQQPSSSPEQHAVRTKVLVTPSPQAQVVNTAKTKALFVPSWTVPHEQIDVSGIDSIIYFGITADETGIVHDDGYTSLSDFTQVVQGKPIMLTVRMTNTSSNTVVMKDVELQKKIMQDAIAIAKLHNFSGILLDFEVKAVAFDSVTKNVTQFINDFSREVRAQDLDMFITLYGDTFYRVRPYDVKAIAQNADGIMIMAYDFHKAQGDPGPNFPLQGEDLYGYSFERMIQDFLEVVPANKITVIFGLYGYDWKVDDKQRSFGQAQAISLNTIQQKFLTTCAFKNCMHMRDKQSSETKVTYTDTMKDNHVVWFEDMESVAAKTVFLETHHIMSTALWAYSYF